MKNFLIIYQLALPESTHSNLIAYLKTATGWARPTNSSWIIKTTADAAKIRDGVRQRIGVNDKVLVIEVSKNWATGLVAKDVTEWMKNNL